MANVDNPHGLTPTMRTFAGGAVRVLSFAKLATYGTALFINDVVAQVATADLQACTTSLVPTGVNLNYGAASTATTHLVVVSPDAVFEAQDNNDTDGIAYADLGLNCDLEFNAGSATTQISGHEIDESTAATTNTLYVHLIQKHPVVGNDYGSFCRVEVIFNKHRYSPGTAGV